MRGRGRMRYNWRMSRDTLFSIAFVTLIITGTMGYILFSEPENMVRKSDDGEVMVSGMTRATEPFAITKNKLVAAPLLGSSYAIEPKVIDYQNPVTVAFALPENGGAETYALYKLNDSIGMWDVVPGTLERDDWLTAEVNRLGEFALGGEKTVLFPQFPSVYDEIVSGRPRNAISYETSVGYRVGDGSVIHIPELDAEGGCTFLPGEREELVSETSRTVRVLVDDVEMPVDFLLRTLWTTGDDTCPNPLPPVRGGL